MGSHYMIELVFYEILLPSQSERNESPASLIVEDVSTYLEARRKISSLLDEKNGDTLKIEVHDKRFWSWFKDLKRIGDPLIRVRRFSPKRDLEDKWQCTLPTDLSAEDVVRMNLLSLSPPQGESVVDHIFRSLLGDVWIQEGGTADHVAEVLKYTIEDNSECRGDTTESSWLAQKKKNATHDWKRKASKEYVASFYAAYNEASNETCKILSAGLYAAGINKHAKRDGVAPYGYEVLSDLIAKRSYSLLEVDEILSIAGSLGRIEKDLADVKQRGEEICGPYIRRYWKSRLHDANRQNKGRISDLLQVLPGHTKWELEALSRYLKGSSETPVLTPQEDRLLDNKFGAKPGGREQLKKLRANLVLPCLPTSPEPGWKEKPRFDAWREWLVNEYLPFKAALDQQGSPVGEDILEEVLEEVESRATDFSDWMISQYSSLMHDGSDMVTSVSNRVTELIESGQRVVWLIWDNLPAHHASKLAEEANGHGLHLEKPPEWKLAVLPSLTRTSLPALLSGVCNDEVEAGNEEEYRRIVQDSFRGKSIGYENSLRNLESFLRRDLDLYALHYRAYDELLHKPDYKLEDKRARMLSNKRDTVLRRFSEAFKRMPSDRKVSLIVSSDHGSTRLAGLASQIQVPREIEEHESLGSRVLRLADYTDTTESYFDSQVSTVLDPKYFSLKDPFVIARGFSTWSLPRKGSGYVHGGALPEEVVTPLLTFKTERVEYSSLTLRVKQGGLVRGESRQIELQLSNGNDAEVGPVHLEISIRDRLVDSRRIDKLPAQSSVLIPFDMQLEPYDEIEDGSVEVSVEMAAEYLGRVENQEIGLSVPASERAVDSQTGQNLDSFFE